MRYMETVLSHTKWDVVETWEFSEGFVLALCEVQIGFDLSKHPPFYVLFEEGNYMMLPDDIGDKLSGKKKGVENDDAS